MGNMTNKIKLSFVYLLLADMIDFTPMKLFLSTSPEIKQSTQIQLNPADSNLIITHSCGIDLLSHLLSAISNSFSFLRFKIAGFNNNIV